MKLIINLFLLFFLSTKVFPFENPKINLGKFSLNKYEITIKEFEDYANKKKIKTLAEKKGGGFEWGTGWERRTGWTYKTPYGVKPESNLEPAVHINKFEAEAFCNSKGGRLPKIEEWKLAAYTQLLNSDQFVKGKTYIYPSGDKPTNLNSQGVLNYNKHMNVTLLPSGINDLVAMGGNVWEWIDHSMNDTSLTAGASWWYGADKTRLSGFQYKQSDFYAVYIGFRCSFDN